MKSKVRWMKLAILALIYLHAPVSIFAQFEGWENVSCTNQITSLVKDGFNLWIGTYAGLVCMNIETNEFTVYNRANSPLLYNRVTNIELDREGNVWVACDAAGQPCALVKIDDDQWAVYDASNSPLNEDTKINDFAIDQDNNFWVAINAELYQFDGADDWQEVDIESVVGLIPDINSIAVGTDNVVWFGLAMNGLVSYDVSNETWEVFNTGNSGLPHDQVYKVEVDNSNVVLLTVNQLNEIPGLIRGLVSYDGSDWIVYSELGTGAPTSSEFIRSIYFDEENTVWVGCEESLLDTTSRTALNHYINDSWQAYDTSNSELQDIPVTAMTDNSLIGFWVGQKIGYDVLSEKGALYFYSTFMNEWSNYNTNISGLPDNGITAITVSGVDN